MSGLANLARMTTNTTGTGTITLGAAVSGCLTFALACAAAGIASGSTVTYGIEDGSNSEVGRGVWTTPTTLTRATVLASTNANAKINLSGSAEVFIIAAAEDIRFRGALVHFASNIVNPSNITSSYIVAWDTEDYDTDGIWSAGDPTKLIVPTGVTRVKVKAQLVSTATVAANATFSIQILKGASSSYIGMGGHNYGIGSFTDTYCQAETQAIVVSAGDAFTCQAVCTDGTMTLDAARSSFGMQIID